jgi:UDP-glucose 4-epimerase
MGVVYYANYFVWFEIGRTDLLRTLGSTYRQLEAEGLSLPVIDASCQCAAPCLYDDELAVVTRAACCRPSAWRSATWSSAPTGRSRRAAGPNTPPSAATGGRAGAGVSARSPDGVGPVRPARVIQMRSMHALVTGAAGFIASRLEPAARPRRHGARRRCVHRLLPAPAGSQPGDPDRPPRVLVHRGPARSGGPRPAAGRRHPRVPLRRPGRRPPQLGRDFRHYTVNNVEVTQRLLEAVASRKIERFLYASTSSVYGDLAPIPMREDVRVQPVSPYGVTKLAGEQLCFLYHVNYGVPTVALRLFTVYGPRQRPDMAPSPVPESRPRGGSITLFGDGEQTRDFTYVGDVAEAARLGAVQGVPGRVYNIGGGSGVGQRGPPAGRGHRRLPRDHRSPRPQPGDMRDTFADVARPRRAGLRAEDVAGRGLAAEYAWLKPQLGSLRPAHTTR